MRLYDFVLKNTKLSEVKRVFLPIAEPQCGDELTKAMVLFDSTAARQEDNLGTASVEQSQHMSASAEDLMHSHESAHQRSHDPTAEQTDEQSVTDSDMEEVIKHSGLDHKSRKILH